MCVHFTVLHSADTSRPKESGEIDGSDYHFISRPHFETEAAAGRFLEHGEYDKQYYGTSLERSEHFRGGAMLVVLDK